jgi:hypothetical protein
MQRDPPSYFELEKRRAHYRRKLYIGRGLHCAIYIILSLGFSDAGIFFLPMSVRPRVCFRGTGRELVNRIS